MGECIIRCEKGNQEVRLETSTSISSHDQETEVLDLSCKLLPGKCTKIMEVNFNLYKGKMGERYDLSFTFELLIIC